MTHTFQCKQNYDYFGCICISAIWKEIFSTTQFKRNQCLVNRFVDSFKLQKNNGTSEVLIVNKRVWVLLKIYLIFHTERFCSIRIGFYQWNSLYFIMNCPFYHTFHLFPKYLIIRTSYLKSHQEKGTYWDEEDAKIWLEMPKNMTSSHELVTKVTMEKSPFISNT